VLEMHFLFGLVNILKITGLNFTAFSVDAFWHKDECVSFWGQSSKVRVTA